MDVSFFKCFKVLYDFLINFFSCKECKHQVDKTYVNNILERAGSDLNAMEKTKENCQK